MINKSVLVKAIEARKAGEFPNFSNIELNQAVDLVLFENFNIDEVCQMNSDELDMASNPDEEEFGNSDDWYICPNCGKKVYVPYDGERDEAYTGSCECGQRFYVSCYGMDDYCETLSEQEMNCFNSHEYVQESINNYYKNFVKKQVVKEEVKPVVITIESLLQQNKVSVRTHNVLIVAGYKTLNDVNEKIKSINDLMKIRNLGRSSIKEVAELLKSNFNVSYEL